MSEKKTSGRELLFSINGFEVYRDGIYEVKDKTDGDAPSGYVKAGVSKLPSDGVSDSFNFDYVLVPGSTTQGVWDTGFHKSSPCYRGMTQAEITKEVNRRVSNILNPYQEAIGIKDALEVSNQDSLDRTVFEVYSGRVFVAADVIQAMTLYAAILGGKLAPEKLKNSGKYLKASYYIVDLEAESRQKETSDMVIMRALSTFNRLYDKDKDKLDTILIWDNFSKYPSKADRDTVSSLFFRTISSDIKKANSFLKIAEDAETEVGESKLYLYSKLKTMLRTGTDLKTAPNGVIQYKGETLGGDLKVAADNLSRNADLKGIKDEILFQD